MRFFSRHSVIVLVILFLFISISGCASDTKKFAEISNGFIKSANLLKKEPGITGTASAGNPDKNLFKVCIVIDLSIMTDERFRQVILSFLTNVASFTSEKDPQKLLEPYNVQIEVQDIGKSIDGYKVIAEKPFGSSIIRWKSIDMLTTRYEGFLIKAREMGLTESMLKTLENAGFTEREILQLTPEKIAELFAPGSNWDGGFDIDENHRKELNQADIDNDMIIILFNLGYTSADMLALSANEIDFIFPNTELMANLQQKGFSEQEVQSKINKDETFKDIIKEALTR